MDTSHSETPPYHRDCSNARRIRWTIAAILASALGGCGGQVIPVHGTVQREGTALSAGRIVLTPVGGGMPAHGDIENDGTFHLTIERPSDADASGTYRVQILETTNLETGKLYTNYVGPSDKPLDVRPGATNEFVIDIRQQDGWQIHEDK